VGRDCGVRDCRHSGEKPSFDGQEHVTESYSTLWLNADLVKELSMKIALLFKKSIFHYGKFPIEMQSRLLMILSVRSE
jgi:hypothetical protein